MPALYRRYRPETFQEVIGQSHVTDPLRHALASNRSNHAYLFSGPRGCGKTTSARILARCLNCAEGPTDTPCGVCESCIELSRGGGGSLDVVEIDAASHNGVDDARELRERAVFAPARDRYKIYILDEAHMVTQQGFNALLKIVEEPPPHVKFIFATTEPEKVLTTIRSRTHHYPFRLVPPGELLGYLESVAESEGITLEQGVLALVVRSGGGSVRDSLSLLDQLIAGSSDKTITRESAQALLGYTPRASLDTAVEALAYKDASKAFHTIDDVVTTGLDPRRFAEDLLAHVRDVIVIQATGAESADLFPGVSEADLDAWQQQASWFSSAALSSMAESINHALGEMSGVTSAKLQLELLFAQLLSQGVLATPAAAPLLDRDSPVETSAPVTPSEPAVEKQSQRDVPPEDSAPAEPSSAENGTREPLEPWTLEGLQSVWPTIIEDLSQHKRSLWVALSDTVPLKLEGDVLTIGFNRLSDAEILKKPQGPGSPLPNADVLREAIFANTGHRVKFTVSKRDVPSSPAPEQASASAPEEAAWPVVSRAAAGENAQQSDVEREDDGAEPVGEHPVSAPDESSVDTTPIATRGEPVVRQLLGGELVAEEILDSMSDQGEGDV